MKKTQKLQNAYPNLVWKNARIGKCLSQLGMEKHKNRKMSISIRYGKNIKNVKIAKCLSQLGMEKRKNRKMSISIRYGKNVNI